MTFRNREALQIESAALRVTVLKGGGHIAEILHKATGVSPLWIPPWPSIEPSDYDPAVHSNYGLNEESRLLCGIMGHNLCLDTFGPPTEQEAQAGISVHGEASVAAYEGGVEDNRLQICALLTLSGLRITRTISLNDRELSVHVRESVENLSPRDRPIAWTQHVTLGPPYLVPGETRFQICAERSRVFESPGFDAGGLTRGADFIWPHAPCSTHATSDLTVFAAGSRNASFTTHLIDRRATPAYFAAWSPSMGLLFGYQWHPRDFPWLGMWEENKSRTGAPWLGNTVACGMEFGVSPFPESKGQMIAREQLFEVPSYRVLRAREQVTVEYLAFLREVEEIPTEDTLRG